MIILTLRSDNPEAEIGLFDDNKKLGYIKWSAHRQLAETLHQKIESLLVSCGKQLDDLQGLVVFEGPGSFTGLRIGLAVGNTLAYSKGLKLVGSKGEKWLEDGLNNLILGMSSEVVLPDYGAPVHITPQKR